MCRGVPANGKTTTGMSDDSCESYSLDGKLNMRMRTRAKNCLFKAFPLLKSSGVHSVMVGLEHQMECCLNPSDLSHVIHLVTHSYRGRKQLEVRRPKPLSNPFVMVNTFFTTFHGFSLMQGMTLAVLVLAATHCCVWCHWLKRLLARWIWRASSKAELSYCVSQDQLVINSLENTSFVCSESLLVKRLLWNQIKTLFRFSDLCHGKIGLQFKEAFRDTVPHSTRVC